MGLLIYLIKIIDMTEKTDLVHWMIRYLHWIGPQRIHLLLDQSEMIVQIEAEDPQRKDDEVQVKNQLETVLRIIHYKLQRNLLWMDEVLNDLKVVKSQVHENEKRALNEKKLNLQISKMFNLKNLLTHWAQKCQHWFRQNHELLLLLRETIHERIDILERRNQ